MQKATLRSGLLLIADHDIHLLPLWLLSFPSLVHLALHLVFIHAFMRCANVNQICQQKVWMMKRIMWALLMGMGVLGGGVLPAQATDGIKTQAVQFKKGESGATLKGSIKGDQTLAIPWLPKGLRMVVTLQGSSSTDFNVLPPGSDEAIFIGSAAKSSKAHAFTLEVEISG